ncbi:hypothetical protein vseg_004459 [Gypsophila vaccaria]
MEGVKYGFLNNVLSWSYEDILNEHLYKEKVKMIPESFQTVPEYFNSYIYPLLEETRADLCSSLETISGAPYAQVVSYKKVKSGDSFLYDVNVDGWMNRFDRGKEPYKTLPGDVFALVKFLPKTATDLQVVARTWVLASARKILKQKSKDDDNVDDDSSSTYFRVETSKDMNTLDDGYSSLFVIFLINSLTNKRIWDALHMNVNLKIIRGVLQRRMTDEDVAKPCCPALNGISESSSVDLSSTLNQSQVDAVLAAVQATQCVHKSQVQLVWGPPGTGKTKTVSTFLFLLLQMEVRTLTCTPTNVAIKEVASRVLLLVRNASLEDSHEPFDFTGNILLFGNKERLSVGSDIEDIYLVYRVKRLAECFAPSTGWRSCFMYLSNFLEDCVSDYNVFLKNELTTSREQGTRNITATLQIDSFLGFVRNRFVAAAVSVRRCISIFGTHVARSYIGERNVSHLRCLVDLLNSFEQMLNDHTDSEELLKLFSPEELNDARLDVLPPIEATRRRCISVLKTLFKSLGVFYLPTIASKESLTKLCFRMASLIFRTASSSSRLYFMKIKPLSLLVIDEAAQLKECESAIPLQLPGLRHAILFGDECQLPAMVKSNVSAEADFGRSLFQRLSSLGQEKHLLNVQYRMHPSISAFPNSEFYANQISDAPCVKTRTYERQYLAGPMYGPYSFINVSEGRDEFDDDGHSRKNMVEAAVVANILQNLFKNWRQSTERLSVGVVSPYAAQVFAIEDLIGKRYEKLNNFVVKVRSVDGFQGGEEDIIILSTVRANNSGQVGFISDCQRTNVALTRARHCLWVLGNERTLSRSESVWKRLVHNAQERNCYFNADEDKSLAEAMINMKNELNQLDDLLKKDSIVFKNTRWKVLFSDNFVKSFCKLPSARLKKLVMNVLVKLSNGWRPKKVRVDPVCDSTIQIVKQYKVEGRYIISTNDIVKESIYTQVLKIWDIIPLEDVSALVRKLDNIYGAFTNEFLSLCKEKCLEGDHEVPKTWSTSLDIVRRNNNSSSAALTSATDGELDAVHYAENSRVSDSLLLMKFYSLSAGTVGHLLSDSDGQALDLPFEVTDQEMEIITHSESSFILGRSGTGKTTVLTMKLFQKEQLHHMASEGFSENRAIHSIHSDSDENVQGENVLRQLFVTVSPKLCYAIKQHVSHLKSFAQAESTSSETVSIGIDHIDDGDQFRGIPDSFVGLPPKLYPLVVTFNKFLLMLDGTLGASYFHRFQDTSESSFGGSITSKFLMTKKEVNYDKFSALYWPHFNSQLTKKLDASRVFTEIISCIKGGLQVGDTDDGRLTMEGYLNLSQGRTSTLSHQKREAVYQIFLDYEKMKLKRREFDLADFVNDLHRRLKHERYDGDPIDFVYIDEVQDLTMRQIALFKYICRNVEEGFVFSGDTAQTIARGIDFRFQDVRCLFYKEFLRIKMIDEASGISEKGHIAPIFQLSENFRTHAGILKLGHSVIELIYHFFPQSIDVLSPETSLIFGEAPILLESGADENAIVTIFGNNGNVGSNLVGFGAEQVILVRDECVRKEVSNHVGKSALVLTIVECKGLEFQDVLLYNFFGSSPLRNHWRVIYEYMNAKNLLDPTLPAAFPQFSSAKHNILCSELKQLYVAITRTRQRLWICENKEELSKPMFDYWKKLCVVQVRELDDSLARAMQVASSPEEWKVRGKKLLAVENYEVATMCFERAGDKHWETLAKALGLKASAGRMNELNPEEAASILRQAGELFESINIYAKAADCYFELKDYNKAGKLYFEHCDDSYLEKAGECFTLTGCYEQAATVYAKCNRYSECLSSCTEGKLFDTGLQYIQYWNHQNAGKDLDRIEQVFLENCALSQLQQDDKRAMMKFVKAMRSQECMRAFLEKWGCFDELMALEEELGNFSVAADIAWERGELLRAGKLYFEHCDDSYLEKAGECFTLSGCYERAATVYAKCNRYSECLSSCTKGKLFDAGLQYIQYWKHQNVDEDLDTMEQVFLENCALSLLHQDDKKAMMKFVKALRSQDSMRAFLKKCGCYDELMALEEELGNFSMAADIARERGEFLLEADLLYKGGFFKEACEYFSWHVFASCLWAEGSKGWPLKHFPMQEELLLKAKASAHMSGQRLLYENICTEVLILMNRDYTLPQLRDFLVFFRNQKNVRGELVLTKRILELILQTQAIKYEMEVELVTNPAMDALQRISKAKVSVETLIYFWKSWQEAVLAILKYLDSNQFSGNSTVSEIGEFCLNYLGVRKIPFNAGAVYVCLYPDSEWPKEVNKSFFKKFGKLVSIDIPQLLLAARNHWCTELASTGMKVLAALKAIQERAKLGQLPEFYKTRIPMLVFEAAQFLSSLKSVKHNYHDSESLQRCLDSSMVEYFHSVFPLDWRKVVSKDVICLRETEVSSKILERVISMYIEGKEDLTYWKLGRVAMGLLGFHKTNTELCETVARKLHPDSPWKLFFNVLSAYKRTDTLIVTSSNRLTNTPEFCLAGELLGSVHDAYSANWRAKGCISPFCLLYLADRLMVSLLELQGGMFIMRSSLVEWFIHLDWKCSHVRNLSADGCKSGILRETYDFLAHVIHQILVNTRDTVAWVKNVGINAKDNFPVLLLRLVSMMSLIHLNTLNYKDKLLDVLRRGDITSQLPPAFCNALQQMTHIGITNAVALALISIGDPLVIVSIGEVHSSVLYEEAIYLNICNQNREDLLGILFPNKMDASQGRVNDANLLGSSDGQEADVQDLVSKVTPDWNVWELFETLKLVVKDDNRSWQRFVSTAANVKVQVDKLHDLMRAVTAVPPEIETCANEHSSMLAESELLLLELQLLSALLGSSGQQLTDSMPLIRDTAEKLLSGKKAFEYFLSPLIPPTETTTCPEKNQADEAEKGETEVEANEEDACEDPVKEDTSLATSSHQGSSKAGETSKGKQNKKKKSKKGKRKK